MHKDRKARLIVTMQSEIDKQRLPGVVMMVVQGGQQLVFEALGQQNPNDGTRMALDSIFRIYSMTKPIVSVAVMMLMEQGKLLLNDPVSKHLPEFFKQIVAIESGDTISYEPVKKTATVQDLLRHTSGLTYEIFGNSFVQKAYRQANIGMSAREPKNSEFSKSIAAIPLQFQPGTTWEYSRSTDVLGALIEAVTGQTLGNYLYENIFNPLGMHETAFFVPMQEQHRIAEPFKKDPDGGLQMRLINIHQAPVFESGGRGLACTAQDYALFLQMLLNKGALNGVRLLSPYTVDFMTADHIGGMVVNRVGPAGNMLPAGHGFGLGFAVRKERGLSSVLGSTGTYYWGGSAGTSFFVDPALDMFAIMMIQAPNQRDYYRPLFRNLVYAALV